MSQPSEEEEKGELAKVESIETSTKDIINKLKLLDLFGKAIDRLAILSIEKASGFFLLLETSTFQSIKKYIELISSIKTKQYVPFVTKSLIERAVKA
jgi:hypothetical protein